MSNKYTDGIVEIYDSSPAMTFAVSKSQRTLNGLAFLVNNMYITYAIQHGYLSYIFPYIFNLKFIHCPAIVSLMLSLENITSTQNDTCLQ